VLASISLTGCLNKEAKIVDLAGGVFIVFAVLVGFKYLFPVIARTHPFKRFADALKGVAPKVVIPLFLLAIILVAAGFFMEGIHKVLIFVGFVVAIIAVFTKKYAEHDNPEKKKHMLEIVLLSVGVLAVLMLLWYLGADLFAGF
jgi:hypothetical protein